MRRLLSILITCLPLGACVSTLEVQVDILNPGVVQETQRRASLDKHLWRTLRIARSSTDEINLKRTSFRGFDKALNEGCAEDLKLATTLAGKLTAEHRNLCRLVDEGTKSCAADFSIATLAQPRVDAIAQSMQLQYQYWKELDQRARACQKKIAPVVVAGEALATIAKASTSSSDDGDRDSIISPGDSVRSSEKAYALASAPESAWSKRFNLAKGQNFLGDGDIAIKLNSQGNFSVKGLTFDPSSSAKLLSKVAIQSLSYYAQLSGLPLGFSNGFAQKDSTNAADTSASHAIGVGAYTAGLASAAESRRLLALDRVRSLMAIGVGVFGTTTNSSVKTTAERKAAKEVFSANSGRLDEIASPAK
jgi:hypothetical protein